MTRSGAERLLTLPDRDASRYAVVGAAVAAVSLGGFLLAGRVFEPWAAAAPPAAHAGAVAVLGMGLLLGDAVLPVPSSLVMIGLGSTFGLVGGAALALVGRVGGTLVGFAIGRRLSPAGPPADGRATRLLHRWGCVAVTVSRPVPILGETVAVVAGMTVMTWPRVAAAAAAGALPEAVLFSWVGASARGAGTGALLWIALVLAASAVWAVERGRPPARRTGSHRGQGR